MLRLRPEFAIWKELIYKSFLIKDDGSAKDSDLDQDYTLEDE